MRMPPVTTSVHMARPTSCPNSAPTKRTSGGGAPPLIAGRKTTQKKIPPPTHATAESVWSHRMMSRNVSCMSTARDARGAWGVGRIVAKYAPRGVPG